MVEEVRVVLAEDSPTVRRHLANIIAEAPGMRVVGEARNGHEAVQLVAELQPDVVSMDIKMPEVDGLEATRRIMAKHPTPVVVVSGMLETEMQLSLQALEAGALAVVGKPPDRKNPAFPEKVRELVTTLRAMSGVRVISRRVYPRRGDEETTEAQQVDTKKLIKPILPEVLAIGASTGGPSALNRMLKELPADLPVPVLIVQHMPDEFISGLARWLDSTTDLRVEMARNGTQLEPGVVLVAPGSFHLTLGRRGEKLVARLIKDRGAFRHQPSVDVLFESVASVCGSAAIGVLLTGMGDDGASGLLAMRHKGAYTLAQDESSCTVYGMPRAALEIGAVQSVEPLANLSSKILKLV